MISILLTLLLASDVEAPSWTLQLPPDPRIIALEVKLSSGENGSKCHIDHWQQFF